VHKDNDHHDNIGDTGGDDTPSRVTRHNQDDDWNIPLSHVACASGYRHYESTSGERQSLTAADEIDNTAADEQQQVAPPPPPAVERRLQMCRCPYLYPTVSLLCDILSFLTCVCPPLRVLYT
jgi:hypothetical protein